MRVIQTVIVVSMMLLTSMAIAYFNKSNDSPLLKHFNNFPMQIGGWRGETSRFNDEIYDALGVDESILAHFQRGNEPAIELYIGYYQSQRKGNLIHSPKNCMPGAGWQIIAIEPINLNLGGDSAESIQVNKVILKKGQQTQLMFYWFHSRGRVITSEYLQKIYLVWDSITRHRTDGSFIRLITPVNTQNEQEATKSLTQFCEQLFPLLNEYLPQ